MTSSEKTTDQEISDLREKNREYENLIHDLSTPIIPSIVPNTILVPLMGSLNSERFIHIQEKIVKSIVKEKADTVLIDFTAISSHEIEDSTNYQILIDQIKGLVGALRLMGAETLFVGFSSQLVKKLVSSNATGFSDINAHATFRTGLQYVLDKKGMEIRKKVD